MKSIAILILLFATIITVTAQAPKRELRGAWIATVSNIDWPSATSLTAAQQRAQLENILDAHKANGLNAVFFQIRTQCDALYSSSIEPWANWLTGTQGTDPGYDPLSFAIAECRKRGLEFHAWLNPYRAVINFNQIGTFSNSHIAVARPDLLLAQGTLRILDPGKTEVWEYVLKVVMDIVRRYDVDGIHYDDYFYPYPPAAGTAMYNDTLTFQTQPRGISNIQEWRRANIDSLIKRTNDSVHTAKPWVKFGVSPFGIWRNSSSDPQGSATSGLQSYSDVYANSRKWIQNNWVDYLAPQNYWSIGFPAANYGVLIPWWNANAFNRHIYSGMAAYKINNGGSDANWNNPSQIPNQIRLNRAHPKVLGGIYYNTKSLNANPLGVTDSMKNDLYKRASLLPNMPWIDNVPPQPASAVTTTLFGTNNVLVKWNAAPNTSAPMDKVRQYVVYRFNANNIVLNDSSAIRTVTPVDTLQFLDTNVPNGTYYYTVTSLDRGYNESTAANTAIITLGTTNINTVFEEAQFVRLLQTGYEHTIAFQLNKQSLIALQLLNTDGQLLWQQSMGRKAVGLYQFLLPTKNLPSGVYMLQLHINGKTKTVRFIK